MHGIKRSVQYEQLQFFLSLEPSGPSEPQIQEQLLHEIENWAACE